MLYRENVVIRGSHGSVLNQRVIRSSDNQEFQPCRCVELNQSFTAEAGEHT